MKTYTIILALILTCSTAIFAQGDCSKYYPFNSDVKAEITSYDKKGKKTTSVNYTVKSVNNNIATIATELYDKKGEFITNTEYDIECTEEGISIDFKSMFNNQLLKQYKDMDLELTGNNINLPNNLTPGTTLPDANLDMVVKTGAIKLKMFIKMTNRKVLGNETVTTPAGTFDCVILTNDTEIKMGIKSTTKYKQWIAEGIGMVKSEDYNKNGKLISTNILTKFKN
ncbi:hypothetical protein [Cellulophaga lytica]|uniref:DUF3108 domain-containing protein n=1 Tax=Cellulophaga lytica (strain ATCC 23178 / DSM 7489 / JCM 8516 / NBRC 14961 / NCIMB 1423 / VKM B-1433 / Cy l20) TaxID=867900 RepID=F0RBA6_CELLC|nr:hypothetical protein [Cellulophaga lytica]ADY28508.1 hypothetical protein Celly_0674 [Cellulophaga lytica DSM 7489]AIM59564.1 hypothetical protein IX49_03155 [Cellulophaga lytica]APU09373.1 hypothetical protein A5M85_03475 [Cellulophaga lytica]MDO6854807.1 hypothetical protein [Cellulophaga lytica]WQG77315.1 hypothetical protein SR888_16665 [Cellulophaga lytica]